MSETINTDARSISLRTLSGHEFKAAEMLWYDIYVREMQREQAYTSHEIGTISDPLQAKAIIVGAFFRERLIGTVRANLPNEVDLSSYLDFYDVERLGPEASKSCAVVTRIMVRQEFRSTTASVRLSANMFRLLQKRGVRWILCDCNDPVLPFFLRLGFEIHKEGAVHPDYGTVTILKIDSSLPIYSRFKSTLLTRFAY